MSYDECIAFTENMTFVNTSSGKELYCLFSRKLCCYVLGGAKFIGNIPHSPPLQIQMVVLSFCTTIQACHVPVDKRMARSYSVVGLLMYNTL